MDDLEKLSKHYAILAQILDGLWYLEIEKKFGFNVAYEIDDAVWKKFSQKEGRRLKSLLGIETPKFEDIEKILSLAIFDQSLKTELIKIKSDPLIVHFIVKECKTYIGMNKAGRPKDQVFKICKGIGITFFKNLLKVFDPMAEIKCLYCPHGEIYGDLEKRNDSQKEEHNQIPHGICMWEFILPGVR